MLFQNVYTFEFSIMLSLYGIEHFDSKDSPPEISIVMYIYKEYIFRMEKTQWI